MERFNETGRSMLEMLAVLSIIGLLSAVSIFGYRHALESYSASQTVDRLMKRAVTISGQKTMNQPVSLNSFGDDGEYPITLDPATVSLDVPTFALEATDIPYKVCVRIKNMQWEIPVIIPEGDCAETNTMRFTFNNDLHQDPPCEGTKCGTHCCPGDSVCNEGKCCIAGNCCEPGTFPFCNVLVLNSESQCQEYSCGDIGGTLSDWAQPPGGSKYRVYCATGKKPYCSFAVFVPHEDKTYCYESLCCDGEIEDARDLARQLGGGQSGKCNGKSI